MKGKRNRIKKHTSSSENAVQTDLSFDELLKAFINTPPPNEPDCLPNKDDEAFADDIEKSPSN